MYFKKRPKDPVITDSLIVSQRQSNSEVINCLLHKNLINKKLNFNPVENQGKAMTRKSTVKEIQIDFNI